MITLRVIVDEVTAVPNGGMSRYAEELTRQLIATAPRGSNVAGIVSASPEPDYAHLAERLPGLVELYKSPLARRELAAAWAHGFTRLPGAGMVHATSLLAPMHRHLPVSGRNDQTVVTVHDAIAWTDPELLSSRQASWNRAMTKRAERFADAVVTPTHAVAEVLAENFAFGDRLRVIGGAPSSRLHPMPDAAERRERLGLRGDYLLTVAALDPRKGLEVLIEALSRVPEHHAGRRRRRARRRASGSRSWPARRASTPGASRCWTPSTTTTSPRCFKGLPPSCRRVAPRDSASPWSRRSHSGCRSSTPTFPRWSRSRPTPAS